MTSSNWLNRALAAGATSTSSETGEASCPPPKSTAAPVESIRDLVPDYGLMVAALAFVERYIQGIIQRLHNEVGSEETMANLRQAQADRAILRQSIEKLEHDAYVLWATHQELSTRKEAVEQQPET